LSRRRSRKGINQGPNKSRFALAWMERGEGERGAEKREKEGKVG